MLHLLAKAVFLYSVFHAVKSQDYLYKSTNGVYRELYYTYTHDTFKKIDQISSYSFPDYPYEIRLLSVFEESITDLPADFFARYWTYFISPQSGTYKFHMKCTSTCRFRLTPLPCAAYNTDRKTLTSSEYSSPHGIVSLNLGSNTRYCLEMYLEGNRNVPNNIGLGITYPDNTKFWPMEASQTFVTPDMLKDKKVLVPYYFGSYNDMDDLKSNPDFPDNPDRITTLRDTNLINDRAEWYGTGIGSVLTTWYKVVNHQWPYKFLLSHCEEKCGVVVDGNSLSGNKNGYYDWNPLENKWYKVQMFQLNRHQDESDNGILKISFAGNGYRLLPSISAIHPDNLESFKAPILVKKTATSITLQWENPKIPTSSNFTLQQVELYFQGIPSNIQSSQSFSKNITDHIQVVTGLNEYSLYRTYIYYVGSYRIRSGSFDVTTNQAAPSKEPSFVRATPRSSTHVDVSFGEIPPEDWNGEKKGHRVKYAMVATDGMSIVDSWQSLYNDDANIRMIGIGSLKKWTFYAFKVAGVTISDGIYTNYTIDRTHQDKPSKAPERVDGYNVSETVINVTWSHILEASRHGIVTKYIVKYYKSNDPVVVYKEVYGGDTLFVVLTGLEWFTRYTIQVAGVTIDSAGIGTFSDDRHIFTDEYIPQVPPPNVRGHNISDTSIQVEFDNITDQFQIYGHALGSIVRYERVDNVILWSGIISYNGSSFGSINKAVLTGLKKFANYSLEVAIRTRRGYQNFSDPIYVMTDQGVPSAPPDNIAVVTPSSTSLRFSWADIPPEEQNGIITSYSVMIRKVNDTTPWQMHEFPHMQTVTQTNVIDGLEKWRIYEYAVAGITIKGIGKYSPFEQYRTDEDIPEAPPTNLKAMNVSKDTLNITWDVVPVGFRRGIITWYRIMFTEADLEEPVWKIKNVRAPKLQTLITELKFYLNYTLKIAASTVKGVGNYSTEIMQATSEAPPVVLPGNFTCHNTSSSSLYCKWDKVKEGSGLTNGIILGYHLYYSIVNCDIAELFDCNNTEEWMVTTSNSSLSVSISNLEYYTNYSVQIQLFNSVSEGWRSPPFYVYTKEDLPSSEPLQIEAFPATSTSILVFWDKIPYGHKHGVIEGYTAYYRRMNEGPNAETIKKQNRAKKPRNRRSIESWVYEDMSTEEEEEEFDFIEQKIDDGDYLANPLYSHHHHVERRALYDGIYLYPEEEMTVNGTHDGMEISDLTEYQWYTIRLTSFTKAGEGPFTEINMTCLQAVPAVGPAVTVYDRYAFDEIKISWAELTYNQSRGTVFEYNIVYYAVNINGEDLIPAAFVKESVWLDYPAHNFTVKNLQPYTTYAFQVAASTYAGVGAHSPPVYGETCRCEVTYRTSYQDKPPILSIDGATTVQSGLIAYVVEDAAVHCCDVCINGHGELTVNWTASVNDTNPKKSSLLEMKMAIDMDTNLILPIHTDSRHTTYKQNPYVPIVYSPGIAVFSLNVDYLVMMEEMMLDTMGLLWTFVLVCAMITIACGLIMWIIQCNPMLFSRTNEKDFPEDLLHGGGAGVWWSLGTVMRLGYGDLIVPGKLARYFSFPVMLIGVILPTVLISGISVIFLTHVLGHSAGNIYGQKVGTLAESYDKNFVRRWGSALVEESNTTAELVSLLKSGRVNRIAVDAITASYHSSILGTDPQVVFRGVKEATPSYGVVLAGDAIKLEKCFRRYFEDNREVISHRTKKVIDAAVRVVENTKVFGSLDSGKWWMTLKVCGIIFGMAVFVGIIYDRCGRRRRNKVGSPKVIHKLCQKLYEVESDVMIKEFKMKCESLINRLEIKHAFQRIALKKHLKKTIKRLKPELVHKYKF